MSNYRMPNTTVLGYGWPEEYKLAVWAKGKIIPNFSPTVWRWDACGRVMNYEEHGNRSSVYGWEIDHIFPVSLGGTDELDNLQPLQWEVNLHKSNDTYWSCPRVN